MKPLLTALLLSMALGCASPALAQQGKKSRPLPTREQVMEVLLSNGDELSEEEVLDLIAQGYETCFGKVVRKESNFRLTGTQGVVDIFDLRDLRVQHSVPNSFSLVCDTPGCIAVKFGNPLSQTWEDLQPKNVLYVNCQDPGRKIFRLTYYYLLRFTDWIAFPNKSGEFVITP
jgi:hypothetical protein